MLMVEPLSTVNLIYSLGPDYEFVCTSLRTDNLNCFGGKMGMTNNMATMPKPESGAKPAEMATPRDGTFGIPLSTKLFKLHTLCSYYGV